MSHLLHREKNICAHECNFYFWFLFIVPKTKLQTYLILLLFGIFQSLMYTDAVIHTNEFAVHIPGGDDLATHTARKYGFLNRGQIGSLKDYYLFEHHNIQKRSNSPSSLHSELLQNDLAVLWVEQQEVKRRVKRSVSEKEMYFHDPLYREQWFLDGGGNNGYDMNVIPAWKAGITGKGVVISILDDGVQSSHPDLAQNYDKEASTDLNDSDDDPSPRDDEDNKHGTRCAGEVAATANNEFCGVGIAYNASIGGVRMLDGSVTDSVEATALSLRPSHIHIYSASWGPDDDGKTVDGPGKLAKKAFEEGIATGREGLGSIFVWASGNGGRHSDNCNCDGYTNSIYTISVSSATQGGFMPWYLEQCSSTLATTYSSGANTDADVVTVDVDYTYVNQVKNGIKPSKNRLCTRSHTGTSASAPIAAAICALALEANPRLTWRDLQHLIIRTSRYDPLAKEDGWITNGIGRKVSTKFGYGLMDAASMVQLAREWQTMPDQQICITESDETERSIPDSKSEVLETNISTTACQNTKNEINYLEHVQVKITLSYRPRGNLHIVLVSPSQTHSDILLPRPHDKYDSSFNDWPFMSVHYWGEHPHGNWKLLIRNDGDLISQGPGKLLKWSLVFYGTTTHPMILKPELKVARTFSEDEEMNYPTRVLKKFAENSINECSDRKKFEFSLNGKKQCIAKCPPGHFGDINDYSCHMCDKSCSSCYGPSYKNCLSCRKYFLSNNICAKSCADGFFPDSARNQCFPCLPSCRTCESNNKCITCKNGLFLDAPNCVTSCPVGTFVYSQVCRKCHHSCESCYGPLPSNCLTCSQSYVLHNSTCLTKCPGHYYVGEELSCNRCHRSCELCTDSNTCNRCFPNWEQNAYEDSSIETCDFITKCPNGGWYDPQSASCKACDLNCEECSLPNIQNCAYCYSGYVWHEGRCMGKCPEGYFFLQDQCSPCDDLCLKCENRDKCLLCKDGFFLHFGKCYPFCPLGYYDDGRKNCEMCHVACLHCTGGLEDNCASCPVGFYLIEKNCLSKCPDGFFPMDSDCIPCYSTCKTCTDFGPMHCTSCYDNSSYSDGCCIPCLDGEFYNKVTRKCERCHMDCGRCFGPSKSNCLSCLAPLRLDEVKHLCLPCCQGSQMKKSECCNCSKHLDVCIIADYPRSVIVNTVLQGYGEVVIPLRHVIPIVIAICSSVILLYVILFGLLQANSMGLFNFKFRGQKYERVPNMTAKFDAEMEKVSLTQELDEEDEIYEKV